MALGVIFVPFVGNGVCTYLESERRLMKGGRWFAAEFMVVVTGVLVALGVQALYQYRRDLERERSYLEQIAADMRETQALMAGADSAARQRDRAAPLLLRSYRTGAPADSIFKWLAGSTQSVGRDPVIGTAEALVNSGDLSLIRNDSIRLNIARYVTHVRERMNVYQDYSDMWRAGLTALSRRVDLIEVHRRAIGHGADHPMYRDSIFSPLGPGPAERVPFPIEARTILRDQELYTALAQMNAAKWVISLVRAQIAQLSQELGTALEGELLR